MHSIPWDTRSLRLSFAASLRSSGERGGPAVAWRQNVPIDFSSTNEYMSTHYHQLGYDTADRRYLNIFSTTGAASTKNDIQMAQDVFNAREGYFVTNQDNILEVVKPTLDISGFELTNIALDESAEIEWTNIQQVEFYYLPKLRETIINSLSSDSSGEIIHLEFYQPMVRGEDVDMAQRTSPVARLVHIDTDFGAHDVEGIISLVEQNSIGCVNKRRHKSFPREKINASIREGNRFAIINAWKGIQPSHAKIGRAHLGLLSSRYEDDNKDIPQRHRCFPTLQPNPKESRWYAYPGMSSDEVLLFKQYDRIVDLPSDIWHCSLPETDAEKKPEYNFPRRSFDVRALVVFDKVVPPELDRYCSDRPRPVLSLEESGCFCDEQAEKRKL